MRLWQILLIIACVIAFAFFGMWGLGFIFEDVLGTIFSWLETACRWIGGLFKTVSVFK